MPNSPNALTAWVYPSLSVTLNPKGQTIPAGGSATFSVVVKNTASGRILNVTTSDPLAPDCSRTSATIPGLAAMNPGDIVTYGCTVTSVGSGFTNTITVTGTPQVGPAVSSQDTAPVVTVVPTSAPTAGTASIAITKNPSLQSIALGATATFRITVKNTGTVPLTGVTVTDPRSPNCNRDFATLAAGASRQYTCTQPNVRATFTNIATVHGLNPAGADTTARSQASVHVAPFTPPGNAQIAITKSPGQQVIYRIVTRTGSHTTVAYPSARFTITVENTGNVTLTDVRVHDLHSHACDRTIGTLAPGKTATYECSSAPHSVSFRNKAVASGKPAGRPRIHSTAFADVSVRRQDG